jgi:hypothetical protein
MVFGPCIFCLDNISSARLSVAGLSVIVDDGVEGECSSSGTSWLRLDASQRAGAVMVGNENAAVYRISWIEKCVGAGRVVWCGGLC